MVPGGVFLQYGYGKTAVPRQDSVPNRRKSARKRISIRRRRAALRKFQGSFAQHDVR